MHKKNLAFTLAEVLIVLGIIGVVAEMTIPTLMNNVNDQALKVAYRKSYSIASQAWKQSLANDEINTVNGWNDTTNCPNNFNNFKAKFKVIKDCNSNNNSDCWNSVGDKWNGEPVSNALAFISADGMAWSMGPAPTTWADGDIFVDTNGLKKPNQLGKDRFVFSTSCMAGEAYPCIPMKINYKQDIMAYDAIGCQHPPCKYTSWMIGAN